MNLLIKKGKSVDQKCNAQYFFQDDQWFNLTAHDMKRTLVNAGMKYHRPQIIPGTSLPNSTSSPSPAPMKSSIHLELTPCDSTSTTASMYKTCLLNTSCDHHLHLDHTNTSPELQDHSIVGSAEPDSLFLILKTYFSWILSVSHLKPRAILKLNLSLNSRDNWMTSTRTLLTLQAQSQPLSKLPGLTHTALNVLITNCQPSTTNTLTLVTTQHYPNFWHTTIVRTWIPLTLQVHYQPLSKLPNIVPITLLQARLRKAIIPTLWLSHTHQILGSMLWKGLLHQQLL